MQFNNLKRTRDGGIAMDEKTKVCEYILERIREYIDEYSDTDVNGYHNSKWCAMKEAEAVVLEAMGKTN